MKRIFAVFLCLLLTGCAAESKTAYAPAPSSASAAEDKPRAVSGVPSEDCFLCSGLKGSPFSCAWGQDNLAFLSLNTAEVLPLEINRYDGGERIEESAGYLHSTGQVSEAGGFDASFFTVPDRGHANGRITLHGDAALDLDRAAAHFCAGCVNRMLDACLGEPRAVGVLHLQTGEVRLLDDRTTGFQLGDFYVANDEADGALDVLAFYCPERYSK